MMGIKMSRFTRVFRNYNIEYRAFKEISKDKPTPAPKHPSVLKYAQQTLPGKSEDEKFIKQHMENLKRVYVVSHDPEKILKGKKSDENKMLPQNRNIVEDPEYGYLEPGVVSEGKITLRQAIEFVYKHKQNPDEWNADVIAKDYKLDLGVTQKILYYFKAHELFMPVQEQKTLAARVFKDLYIPLPSWRAKK